MSGLWDAPGESAVPKGEIQSLNGLTNIVTLFVGTGAACSLLISISSVLYESAVRSSGEESLAAIFSGLLLGGSGLGMLGAILVGMPLWCMWHVRAARNLVAMGESLEFTPGWHAGYWFVPFANLVMPYRAMRELLTRSAAGDREGVIHDPVMRPSGLP